MAGVVSGDGRSEDLFACLGVGVLPWSGFFSAQVHTVLFYSALLVLLYLQRLGPSPMLVVGGVDCIYAPIETVNANWLLYNGGIPWNFRALSLPAARLLWSVCVVSSSL